MLLLYRVVIILLANLHVFDNLAHFYSEKKIIDQEMSKSYQKHANWPKELSQPYIIKASENLLSLFSDLAHGITATAPGFY
jgi:hypothetical protein